jgi:5-methylcytosine-specific restriction endonuclease McrA
MDRGTRAFVEAANERRIKAGLFRKCELCAVRFFVKKPGRQRSDFGRFCNRKCRDEFRRLRTLESKQAKMATAGGLAFGHAMRRMAIRLSQLLRKRSCRMCGREFVTPQRWAVVCSQVCRDRAKSIARQRARRLHRSDKKHTARARHYGVPRQYGIRPADVYARDGWKCKLCGRKISKRLLGCNHDQAPSIDHIVPLSVPNSPGHVWSNVQCAHRKCNSVKRDVPVGQLRLM